MPGEEAQSAPPAPPKKTLPVVDLDAGQAFGSDRLELLRPFKFKGMTYTAVSYRVPNGLDVMRHMSGRGTMDATALMCDLCQLSVDVFDAMYAGDRNRVDEAVGKHLRGVPLTSTIS